MQIFPKPHKVDDLFGLASKVRLLIPSYQRPYSWENTMIEDLFDDIRLENPPYYAGNIIEIDNDAVDNGDSSIDVVDGQQRLTTLAMLLLAVYERANQFTGDRLTDSEADLRGTIKSDIKRRLLFENEPRLRLLADDQLLWRALTDKIILGKLPDQIDSRRRFVKRYKFVFSLIEGEYQSIAELNEFYERLIDVQLFGLAVSGVADAFAIFSSLNSKGKPLTLIDLLKTDYLAKADTQKVDEPLKPWQELLKIFNDQQDDTNSQAVMQFLQNNYDAFESKERSSITKGAALKAYQLLFKQKGATYIEDLISHARYFSVFSDAITDNTGILPNDSSHIRTQIQQLKQLEVTTSYPLLLRVFDEFSNEQIDANELESILTMIVAFYVRRNIVNLPKSSNIRSRLIGLIRELDNPQDEKTWSHLGDHLRELLSVIAPTDNQVKEALNQGIYDSNRKLTRFLLINVNRELGSDDKEYKDGFDDLIAGRRTPAFVWTIEHILPENKNLSEEWQRVISPDDLNKAAEVQESLVHKIGNLTLTGYNSEMRDRSFRDKVDYNNQSGAAGLNSGILINQSILDVGETWESKTEWTPKDIQRRNNWFIDEINKIFPQLSENHSQHNK